MAIKKTIKASVKKGVKKTAKKTGLKKGDQLVCDDCGFVVTIDEVCGCPTYHRVVCCGEPMAARECY